MGGAERWVDYIVKKIEAFEPVTVVTATPACANFYAKVVLHRAFDARDELHTNFPSVQLGIRELVPFTQQHLAIRERFQAARRIYAKFELNELLILLYFCGSAVLKKTIFGLHSPLIYVHQNLTLFQKLHNFVYSLPMIKNALNSCFAIHALSLQQVSLLNKKFNAKNVAYIPNFIKEPARLTQGFTEKKLNVIFIGELSVRKGAEHLLAVIRSAPKDVVFTVLGDGPLASQVRNCDAGTVSFDGYGQDSKVRKELENADVLLMPSRAEGMSLAMLEAISHGLPVISSPYINADELEAYLERPKTDDTLGYLRILNAFVARKQDGTLAKQRKNIWKNANGQFSARKIVPKLQQLLLS